MSRATKPDRELPYRRVLPEHFLLGSIGWLHPAAPEADYGADDVLETALASGIRDDRKLVE
jgi:hypothetical protein